MNLSHLLNAKFAAFLKQFLKYKVVHTIRRKYRKIGRNEPCPCGERKEGHSYDKDGRYCSTTPVKYKKCCYRKDYENGTL